MDSHPPLQDRVAFGMCIAMCMAVPFRVGSLRRAHLRHDVLDQPGLVVLKVFNVVAISDRRHVDLFLSRRADRLKAGVKSPVLQSKHTAGGCGCRENA